MRKSVQTTRKGFSVLAVRHAPGGMSGQAISTSCPQDLRRCEIRTNARCASTGFEACARRTTNATICTNTICEGYPSAGSTPPLGSATVVTTACIFTSILRSRGANAKGTTEGFAPKGHCAQRNTFGVLRVHSIWRASALRDLTAHVDMSRAPRLRVHRGPIRPSRRIDP